MLLSVFGISVGWSRTEREYPVLFAWINKEYIVPMTTCTVSALSQKYGGFCTVPSPQPLAIRGSSLFVVVLLAVDNFVWCVRRTVVMISLAGGAEGYLRTRSSTEDIEYACFSYTNRTHAHAWECGCGHLSTAAVGPMFQA